MTICIRKTGQAAGMLAAAFWENSFQIFPAAAIFVNLIANRFEQRAGRRRYLILPVEIPHEVDRDPVACWSVSIDPSRPMSRQRFYPSLQNLPGSLHHLAGYLFHPLEYYTSCSSMFICYPVGEAGIKRPVIMAGRKRIFRAVPSIYEV